MTKVLVLGGAGMLGSALVARLAAQPRLSTTATARRVPDSPAAGVRFAPFAVGDSHLAELVEGFGAGDYVVNCIGLIKHRMDDADADDRLEAVRVNSAFPYEIARLADRQGFRVSLGEVPHPLFLNVRCSIIGREVSGSTSLVEWLLSQPQGAEIRGFLDHEWNGVTTDTFADLAVGLIESGSELSGTHHFVPSNSMNKSDLSSLILSTFGRTDVTVVPTVTGRPVDRTLATTDQETNQLLWRTAGRDASPSIEDMVRAMVAV
jgi:dTDP-4-dehydrorhamnose reductase